jgi:hypothetical protein
VDVATDHVFLFVGTVGQAIVTQNFPVNKNDFLFDYYFTMKQTPAKAENIFRKIFYSETKRALNFLI